MSTPFFIIGASRSGTTMLRLMLNAHSRLAVPDEMKYFRHVEGQYDLTAWRTSLQEEEYLTLAHRYLDARRDLFPGERDELEAAVLAEEDRTVRGPYRALLKHWARICGKERWGEKTPHNIFYVDVIADMFPDAQFIHVVRDPRAVVQSMNASSYYSNEPVFNALNWRKSIRDGEQLFREHLTSGQLFTVRYEDLVRQTETTLRSVCGFLDEPFEAQMLRFYKTANQHMAGQIKTPSITGPVNEKGLSKWRERLTSFEVSLVERLCREEMDAFGYEPGTESAAVSLRILPKLLYWQWKVWQHRTRRGFEVEFSFLSGTRVRATSWKRWVLNTCKSRIENWSWNGQK